MSALYRHNTDHCFTLTACFGAVGDMWSSPSPRSRDWLVRNERSELLRPQQGSVMRTFCASCLSWVAVSHWNLARFDA